MMLCCAVLHHAPLLGFHFIQRSSLQYSVWPSERLIATSSIDRRQRYRQGYRQDCFSQPLQKCVTTVSRAFNLAWAPNSASESKACPVL